MLRAIIPLIVEPDDTPDGWLGMLVRIMLYFNFAVEKSFDSPSEDLIKVSI